MPPSLPPSPRVRLGWPLVRSLLLAFGFCVLYVLVDWRLSDPPRTALTRSRLLLGGAVWCVIALLIHRVGRAGGRAAEGD